ncbi:MAG: adenylyl-sulfate kinase [Nitrospirota bacterium]|nr:adenylyl-sulfate kinase [Nitrospirota bacterium]MDH5768751.1 adenylyl-sulfate kinase [Nitrospirota bacterium]
MSGIAIWITGLPGSGKSTVADALKIARSESIILRMDELRKIVTPEPTYSDAEREIVYRTLVYVAKILTENGHDVIIDATGNLRRWRELARKLIPKYMEIYLRCPIELCREREKQRIETHGAPKDIYKKGAEGWPVPGAVAPYEEPLNPEIIIDMDKTSLKDITEIIKKKIEAFSL